METCYTLVPEDRIFGIAKTIALKEGCPGFDTYFLGLGEQLKAPLFTDDVGMFRICQRRSVAAWLIRDLKMESLFP